MTRKEALQAVIRFSVPDTSLEKAMIDNDVDSTATYAKADEKAIDLCAIQLLHGLLSEPNISEGGYSVSYDRNAVKERLLFLAKKHNVSEIIDQYKPFVKDASNRW